MRRRLNTYCRVGKPDMDGLHGRTLHPESEDENKLVRLIGYGATEQIAPGEPPVQFYFGQLDGTAEVREFADYELRDAVSAKIGISDEEGD